MASRDVKSCLKKWHLLDSRLLICAELGSCHIIFSHGLYATEARDWLCVHLVEAFLFQNDQMKSMYCITVSLELLTQLIISDWKWVQVTRLTSLIQSWQC